MNGWTTLAGWTLIHFVWQGAFVWMVSGLVLRSLRGASPQARYAVACVALAAMLLAPLLTARVLAGWMVVPVNGAISSAAAIPSTALRRPAALERIDASTGAAAQGVPTSTLSVDSWQQALVACWLAGVVVLLMRLLGGWRRVRALHRAVLGSAPSRWAPAATHLASVLRIHRAVHVVDWAAIDTPTVVGWVRPVIVLPVAALANLTPTQVDAILAHELAHIRRHDFLVNLLQTVVETLLFYHPAVWSVSARVRAEREHCCDEVAVGVCGDPVGYAEALTELETWRAAPGALAVAATDGSLIDRVRRVLGLPSDEAPRPSGVTTLAACAVALALVAGATHFVRASQLIDNAADPVAAEREEAADAETWTVVFNHQTSEMRFIGFTARDLIRFAYQLPGEHVLGGPQWIDDETFTLTTHLDGPPAADETPSIVRHLLEDRFSLKTHIETREVPVYALLMARADRTTGPNLRPSTTPCFDLDAWIAAGQSPADLRPAGSRQPVCGETWDSTLMRKSWVGVTMEKFADELGGFGELATVQGRPLPRRLGVVDRTGLFGRFDVDLYALRPAAALMNRYPLLKMLFEPMGFPSMATAFEQQLGLTLEETTAPSEVIVIDSARRPGG